MYLAPLDQPEPCINVLVWVACGLVALVSSSAGIRNEVLDRGIDWPALKGVEKLVEIWRKASPWGRHCRGRLRLFVRSALGGAVLGSRAGVFSQ